MRTRASSSSATSIALTHRKNGCFSARIDRENSACYFVTSRTVKCRTARIFRTDLVGGGCANNYSRGRRVHTKANYIANMASRQSAARNVLQRIGRNAAIWTSKTGASQRKFSAASSKKIVPATEESDHERSLSVGAYQLGGKMNHQAHHRQQHRRDPLPQKGEGQHPC